MAHPLISTIVIALALAWVFGALAHRLRLQPLVGYLIAGVLIGPATPGFVADQTLASELAEIGVILLMFGVGLHFSLEQLLSVRAIAVPGAIAQIACATLLGMALAHWLGWSIGAGLVFGLALSSPPPTSAPHAACSSPFPTPSRAARWLPRALNPRLNIIARAYSEAKVLHLKKHGASVVILGEHEIAHAMVELVSPGGS